MCVARVRVWRCVCILIKKMCRKKRAEHMSVQSRLSQLLAKVVLRTMSTALGMTSSPECLLGDYTRCSEYLVHFFPAWTQLVCMLACVGLCVMSQLSRASFCTVFGLTCIHIKN